jgi:hypothetical protein
MMNGKDLGGGQAMIKQMKRTRINADLLTDGKPRQTNRNTNLH